MPPTLSAATDSDAVSPADRLSGVTPRAQPLMDTRGGSTDAEAIVTRWPRPVLEAGTQA
ncbi:hypothetical protein ABZ137_35765 [Streptomyces bobili]|uniref:hypothetical protein n=1 Tax=Streptomyces bobili TaxID=67280 RepID=UPI0033A111CD